MPQRTKSAFVIQKSPKSPKTKKTVQIVDGIPTTPTTPRTLTPSLGVRSPASLASVASVAIVIDTWKKQGSATSIIPQDTDLESGDMKTPLSPPETVKSPSDNLPMGLMEDHLRFVRKVCGLLAAQILLTTLLAKSLHCAMTFALGKLQPKLSVVVVLGILGLIVIMSCCCRHTARKSPMNILCLLVVTILESVVCGIAMNVWEVQTVLLALCLLMVVLGVLLCYYSCFTHAVFDTAGPYLLATWVVLGAWPPIMFILTDGQIPQRAAAGIVVFLFCLHIIVDLQRMIRKGYRGHEFANTEHIFAVVSIYLDVVTPTSPLCD